MMKFLEIIIPFNLVLHKEMVDPMLNRIPRQEMPGWSPSMDADC